MAEENKIIRLTGDGSEVTLTLRKTVPENGGPNAK